MVQRVLVDRDSPHGIEAAARQARYDALARMAQGLGASMVLLGHHRQDQAETVLLQALRGGSVAALAAMPLSREKGGIYWVRPWLHQPRSVIEDYGRLHGLVHVDDDSNCDERFARNRLRHRVWPVLLGAFPQAEQALSQTAERLADAQVAARAWAESQVPAAGERVWPLRDWAGWPAALRRESLAHWVRREGGRRLTRGQLCRLADELPRLVEAGHPGQWPDAGLSLYRGVLHLRPDQAVVADETPMDARWARPCMTGAGRWRFEGVPGIWWVTPVVEGGLGDDTLRQLRPCVRQGGEQWQAGPGRPPRALKKQFQAAGVPAWMRRAPMLGLPEGVVVVPGLGVDARWRAPAGQPQWDVQWQPVAPGASDEGAATSDHG
jgi:tRNA(Ile)-lysidine synthase